MLLFSGQQHVINLKQATHSINLSSEDKVTMSKK